MPLFSQDQVLSAVSGRVIVASPNAFDSVSTDTRIISPRALYFALHGENGNGHKYIEDAHIKGASGAIIDESIPGINFRSVTSGDWTLIEVTDTLFALGQLAKYYRKKFSLPVIGVTGSAGKTTVKEMTANILSKEFNTIKSAGNYNNEIGLPLTLFNLTQSHERGVVELGMRGFGQIGYLASIVRPHVAVITNIGSTHMEIMGSKDNIATAKSEILEYITPNGTAVLPYNDEYFDFLKDKLNFSNDVISFGNSENADVFPQRFMFDNLGRASFDLNIIGRKTVSVKLSIPGTIQVTNALTAAAAAAAVGASVESIKEGLETYVPDTPRMRLVDGINYSVIVDDTYNANPEAMSAALNYMEKVNVKGRKIVVLGDMLELGSIAAKSHFDMGEKAKRVGIDIILTVGELAKNYDEGFGEGSFHFNDNNSLIDYIKSILIPGDIVLIKGSHSMDLGTVVSELNRK